MYESRVKMAHNAYGHPEPRIEVRFAEGLHFRKAQAALHLLAAAVELATPPEERWVARLVVSSIEAAGWLSLELLHASDEEAQRGLEVHLRVSRSQYSGVSV